MKDNREQSLVPSLSLSYLLHNSMSQELFGEASKPRNKKQEEKIKLNRENWKGNILILDIGRCPPPLPPRKYQDLCVFLSQRQVFNFNSLFYLNFIIFLNICMISDGNILRFLYFLFFIFFCWSILQSYFS